MGELLGGLIALLMWLLIIPIVLLAVLFGLVAAGVGIAVGLLRRCSASPEPAPSALPFLPWWAST
jgi:hypothetical protein